MSLRRPRAADGSRVLVEAAARSCGPASPPRRTLRSSGQGRYLSSPSSPCSTSMIARQVSSPIRSASASGPIGWFIPSFMTVSIASRVADALYQAVDRLVDHRHQHAVGDEARIVVRLARVLPSRSAAAAHGRGGLVAGLQAADHLDQLHQRHRVHEVHADDLLRPRGRGRQLVIEIDAVFDARIASSPARASSSPKMRSLSSTFSGAASIDEVGVAELGAVRDPRDSAASATVRAQPALARPACRGLLSLAAARSSWPARHRPGDVEPGHRRHLGDPCAHLPGADDA